ncbi:MAG: ATP-grasp domain-containing protein [Prevotella sp.]|nr:ATP-grasp domain-containing protein [Prevotella sp.]
MKRIMILGGGEFQVPLIKRAKKLGYYVILCDFRDDVEGIALSDKHYLVNTLDSSQLIEVGEKEKPNGVVTNSEPAFLSMAHAAEKLGLRCMSVDDTKLYKNKFLMREFCHEHGILSPRYKCCKNVEEAQDFFNEIQKKCIIKPLDNSASRGVFSVNSEKDIKLHFDQCITASSADNPAIIIEEYITGTEFTIDGIMTPKGHRSLAISEKKHYEYNENVAYQLLFDNKNEYFDYDLLRKENDHLVDLTGIPFGLTHAEYKYSNGRFFLIEIQARGGGNYIATDIVPFISGIDSYKEQLKWAVGEEVDADYSYEKLSSRCAVLHFFDVPGKGGVVKEIKELDFLDSLSEQVMYHLNFKVGDTIQQTINDSTRIGWYILKSPNRTDLDKMIRTINNHFKIII